MAGELPPHRVWIFTSAPEYFTDWTGGTVVPLPLDWAPELSPDDIFPEGRDLHYAPTGLPSLARRMSLLAGWIAEHHPERFIVDLSVEVALFVRLCGVRTELVRLHGRRDDPAHEMAFRLSHRLIAHFPEVLDDVHTPEWVRRKTTYLPGRSRYDGRSLSRGAARHLLDIPPGCRLVLIINGMGGGAVPLAYWLSVAKRHPDYHWWVVGKMDTARTAAPDNLRGIGWVKDTFPYLRAANIVVGSGGMNTMWEVGAARRPYISIPESRPFDEQNCMMNALARLGLTLPVSELPGPEGWRGLLAATAGMNLNGWEELFSPQT